MLMPKKQLRLSNSTNNTAAMHNIQFQNTKVVRYLNKTARSVMHHVQQLFKCIIITKSKPQQNS
eukprot:c29362_g1_i1 orf=28-219(-)